MRKMFKIFWMVAGCGMYAAVALLMADHYYRLLDQDMYYIVVNVSYGCGFVLGLAPAVVIIGRLAKKFKERRCKGYLAKSVMYLL